ncbi:hypothetical protein RFI_19024 [Reticulomyxa filosa]|uniref:Uncharacterized protein n=1 Tax=Reticulomyxa filosa TaxID=46433 RepID=X6MYW5_RETFI|nr:hypothetical protein RFI_19024 [Reticulomyxa filosa]|eukprot:ETO18255.1 hypothetical protein RFI_19024 [Reticulomyxa filosa]
MRKTVKAVNEIKDNEKLRHFLLKESGDDILRDITLHQMFVDIMDSKSKSSNDSASASNSTSEVYESVAFWRYSTSSDQSDHIRKISEQLDSFERGWFSSVTGMFASDNEETKYYGSDLLSSGMEITAETYRGLKLSSRQQKKFEAMEEFEPKTFVQHVKAIGVEIEPFEKCIDLLSCLIFWFNPGLTFAVVAVLFLFLFLFVFSFHPKKNN